MKDLGKQAKSIAIYFFNAISVKANSKRFMVTIQQAKALLKAGYSVEEIKSAIDYFVEHPPRKGMYSLGLLNTSIDQALNVIKANEEKRKLETSHIKPIDGGVSSESSDNNRAKLQRYSNERRFGKKYNFDMFEKSGEDN